MKPILFSADDTQFTSNGLGRLADCVSCVVTEERNGIYECEFRYPVTGPMYSSIHEGGVIGVIHDDHHDVQPFDIYGRSAPIDGLVTFYAHHISYRLRNVILKPFTATSCADALAKFQTQTYNPNPFTFWTDKAVNAPYVNDVPAAVRARLAGEEGSILDVYGKGEYQFDKWAVKLYTNRGADNGVAIRYGVNLTDITQEIDQSQMYSAVAPYWKAPEGGAVVTLPEGYVVSPNVPVQLFPWTTDTGDVMTTEDGEIIEFAVPQIIPVPLDMSDRFETQPTVAQLRDAAQRYLASSRAYLPDENIKVSFVDLAHTEEYAGVAALQRVALCDRVSVYCGPIGVDAASMQVIRVVYNVLAEQYDEIELGSPRPSYAEAIMAEVQEATKEFVSRDILAEAVDNATAQITGAQDSHVRFIYDADGGLQEIVIMDTDDIATATKVWRWNSGGLGYSANGYEGPYTTAITQDGAIVADFITTGQLLASLIKVGILCPANGNQNNFWNMETGEFSLKSDGASDGISYKNGVLTINASDILAGTLSANRIAANSIAVSKLTGRISGGVGNSWVLDLDNGTLTIGNISANNITTGTLSADRISGGTINGNNVNVINLKAKSISGPDTNPVSGTFTAYRYVEQGGLEIEESCSIEITNGIITKWTGYT